MIRDFDRALSRLIKRGYELAESGSRHERLVLAHEFADLARIVRLKVEQTDSADAGPRAATTPAELGSPAPSLTE